MKIRFGMLATDAFGKAGGQAIQRRGSIRVLRNITIPTQRLASRQNPQRSISSKLFNGWSFLPRSEREMWSEVGASLSAVNGWGEEKSFSGRQAYTKLNGIAFVKTNALIKPSDMQYEVPFFIAAPFVIVAADKEMTITLTDIANCDFFQLKAMRLRSDASSPLIEKLKTFSRPTIVNDADANFTALRDMFGTIALGNVFSIAVRGVTTFGVVSPWVQMNVTVE
jgi:hypothetical protein